MTKIAVSVKRDHIEALAATKRPIVSLAELIWNGLDADADKVSVRFDENALGGLERIRVADNGSGIAYAEAQLLFGSLGGSWKSQKGRTAKGRSLHGKSGKGRFRAFALGNMVEWNTTSKNNGSGLVDFSVKGDAASLDAFDLTEAKPAKAKTPGTEVIISNIHKNFTSLTDAKAPQEVANYFAVYLMEYPGITIDYNGTIVDPKSAHNRYDNLSLGDITLGDGKTAAADLTVIEWKEPQERALHLCDARGISLHQVSPSIHAPGFNFTAYLKSDHIRELDKSGLLTLEDLHPDVTLLINAAKGKLKEHFRKRSIENTGELLQKWKADKIYPYQGEPLDKVEEAERQVFDVVAVNINSYLSDFDDSSLTSKRLTFNLVKQALKQNPESLQRIFQDVLNLPKEHQDDLAQLLDKTSLSAIISSAKLVANRLDFLRGLELMLFGEESKKKLLERDQLHQVLASETWIFGEEFHLTNNEETLNEVLAKFRDKILKPLADDSPVTLEDGSTGRIDLMLARSVPQPRADEREHLVVELKRPAKKICTEVLGQIKGYAIAVAKDERFRDTKTKWVFWVISNEMTDEARRDSRQRNRPEGLVFDDEELRITVWAKTWGQIIQDCKGRLNFFKEKLDYEATHDSALTYLKSAHEKYIPTCLTGDEVEKDDEKKEAAPKKKPAASKKKAAAPKEEAKLPEVKIEDESESKPTGKV